ncbi:MAG: hypothetical protein PWP33_196 [Thermodesulfobacterium sp.]|nr:hypothetical protein [Thermodesulfobacterium sp.]
MKALKIVFLDLPQNKYSLTALLGSLETKEEILSEVEISFAKTKEELFSEISEGLKTYPLQLACFSFFTTQVWEIIPILTEVKNLYKDRVLVCAGGAHPTGDFKRVLKAGADCVVLGEGEQTFIDLLECILNRKSFEAVEGIAFKDINGKIKLNPRKVYVDLDRFLPFSPRFKRFGPLEITRGCPFACNFCQTSRIFGVKVRHRSIEKVLSTVEMLLKRGLTDIRFITPNAFSYDSEDGKTINLERLEELLKGIKGLLKNRGRIFFGSFPSEVRPEHVTPETISLVKTYASNDNLVIGAQSGSERILQLCKRSHTVEDVYRAVKLTVKAGLTPKVDFIFGLPYETEEDVRQTIKVIKDLVKIGAVVHAHTFIPLPQTPFLYKPPVKLSGDLIKLIKSLTGKGLLFGDWEAQQKLSQKIYNYFKS